MESEIRCLVGPVFLILFSAESSVQFCTAVFTSYIASLCETIGAPRYPYRDAGDTDPCRISKWFGFYENYRSFNWSLNVSLCRCSVCAEQWRRTSWTVGSAGHTLLDDHCVSERDFLSDLAHQRHQRYSD